METTTPQSDARWIAALISTLFVTNVAILWVALNYVS
jgi:hypothetical protein